ncbi:hypothetical protein BDP81DRAFT_396714 [Colletotrichum phormii]|uniref:Oxidase ustYa n=1 Tax=Colletotrichum phormii TaxID=359342 RepID=A0AAJ0EEI4_9PEZI|nr:uncharacterized protein BDP81DRAFT_396714 [Colletotrichum phormii]KAK1634000.1 hypothetical protein BDP81DRAFT_396714 [Colletotrichum phormii]
MDQQQQDCHYEELSPNTAGSKPSFSEEAESFLDNIRTRSSARGYNKILAAFWPLVILQVVLLFVATGSLLVELKGRSQEKSEPAYFYYPETTVRTYWDYDDNFLNHNVTISTEFWKGLFPEGDGIVALNDDEVKSMDLVQSARSFHDPSKSVYLVAAFHQLHCLSQLRSLIIKAHQDPAFSFSDPTYYHTMHCVDVVRQQILCHADGTLIYKRQEDKYPGDGGMRVCNNFEALTHWTKEHG